MALWTYDVTVAEVAAKIGHLTTIDATTSPTSTEVASWINQAASEVNLLLRSKGATPTSYTSTATVEADLERYHTIRAKMIAKVAGEWHAANRNGDTPLALRYQREWREWITTLREDTPAASGGVMGIGAQTNIDSSNTRTAFWDRDKGYT